MKKLIVILILSLTTGRVVFAQQNVKTTYMTITIDDANEKLNMIITRSDTAQVQQHLELNLHVKAKAALAAHENLILNTLKPYFDAGWRLVSTSVEVSDNVSGGTSFPPVKIERYFLSKN